MTKGVGGFRWVVPMLWIHPDRARTVWSAISSRGRLAPVRKTALRTHATRLPHHDHERGGGIGARLRHR
eukprot:754960-Prymnesium_polylepis.1